MCLYEGYVRIGVGMASLLYYCGPVIVMVLSPLLFHERLTRAKLLGFAAVFAGVLLVNGSVRSGSADATGLLCGAASAALYAVMITENRRAVHITGQENAALQMLFGFLTAAVFIGIRDHEFAVNIRPDDRGWIVLLGAVNTGLGCCWYFSAIGQLPVQTVAVCGILSRSRPSCSRPRCCTRRCCRCRYSVRCSSSAVPLAPSACPCCCNGTRSAEPICISANCTAAGAQFFLRPAGVRESTGAKAGQKNRRHTSVCRRFVHLALRNREPLIDGPAYHGVF